MCILKIHETFLQNGAPFTELFGNTNTIAFKKIPKFKRKIYIWSIKKKKKGRKKELCDEFKTKKELYIQWHSIITKELEHKKK